LPLFIRPLWIMKDTLPCIYGNHLHLVFLFSLLSLVLQKVATKGLTEASKE
jgi:hypothetical protein